jgi:CRP/FNR family cyclic AMP-dependent transcriptional regulator
MKKQMTVLILEGNEDELELMSDALVAQEHTVIKSVTGQEARLKFQNQQFDFLVLDLDAKGYSPEEFVHNIRTKEKTKNVKDRVPILLIGGDSDELIRYSDVDNLETLEKPFEIDEFTKKVLTFNKKSKISNDNTKKVAEGEYLITEGSKNSEMYWILSGDFVITKLNNEDKNVIVGEAKTGELIGEMSFLDNLPRSASVKAKCDSEVLVIPHKKFMDTLNNQPRWFKSLMQTLSSRLRDADDRLANKFVKTDED